MSRNQLHITKLEEFKVWLDSEGIPHRPGRGDYQVLQICKDGTHWNCIYERNYMPEHYTADRHIDSLVRKFIRSLKMTNTTQTDLLDGVEPDCWRYSSANGIYRYRGPCANFDKDYKALKPVALYSRETVEALLEANRKHVLLGAAESLEALECDLLRKGRLIVYLDELRRMAMEPTGVDKGEKE